MFMTDLEITDLLKCSGCDKLYGIYCDFNNFNLNIKMLGIINKKCKYKKMKKYKINFTIKKNNTIIKNDNLFLI